MKKRPAPKQDRPFAYEIDFQRLFIRRRIIDALAASLPQRPAVRA